MSDSSISLSGDYARLCDKAVRILAVRDHSEHELRNKLRIAQQNETHSGYTEGEIDRVIRWCYEQNWLNDHQFAIRYLNGRSRKGYGPLAISQGMTQKGISRGVREAVFAECEVDWGEKALDIAERKFGSPLPREREKRIKVQRFLLYRGFLREHLQLIC